MRTVLDVPELLSDFEIVGTWQIEPVFRVKDLLEMDFVEVPESLQNDESVDVRNPYFRLPGETNFENLERFGMRPFELPDEFADDQVFAFQTLVEGGRVEMRDFPPEGGHRDFVVTNLRFSFEFTLKRTLYPPTIDFR